MIRRVTTVVGIGAVMSLVSVVGTQAQGFGRPRFPTQGACFYQDINFLGPYFCADMGASTAIVPRGTNDEISSIRTFGNVEVEVFVDSAFRGDSRRFASAVRNLESLGWNDVISSFRVRTAGRPGSGNGSWGSTRTPRDGACFYEHANYSGRHFCVSRGAADDVPRSANDEISSIRLYGDAEVEIYRDIDFEGDRLTIDRSITNLEQRGWNDELSSYRVTRRGGNGRGGGTASPRRGMEVFVDSDYSGRSVTLTNDTPDLSRLRMGRLISSIRLAPGERWQICSETSYRGRCRTLSDDIRNLESINWNDQAMSARRQR